MNVIKTGIEGVLIIEPRLFRDARGYFFESFSEREFQEKVEPFGLQGGVLSGQREYEFLWRNAWSAFPETSVYTEQAGEMREG